MESRDVHVSSRLAFSFDIQLFNQFCNLLYKGKGADRAKFHTVLQDKKFRGFFISTLTMGALTLADERRISDIELETILDTNTVQPCRIAPVQL